MKHGWRRLAAWTCALLALGLVFSAYLNAHATVDLAQRLWSCF